MSVLRTKELGDITIDERDIITFPEGIPGFEHYHRYAWIKLEEQLPLWYMQSVDDQELRFIVTDPFMFNPHYEFKLADGVKQMLGIERVEDVEIYSLVSIPAGEFQHATMNLLGPIVINTNERLGQQVILHDTSYAMKHPMFTGPREVRDDDGRSEG